MESTTNFLSNQLTQALKREFDLDHNLNVVFNGQSQMDYTYPAFGQIQKQMMARGIKKEQFFQLMIKQLESLNNEWDIGYNSYLYFNPKYSTISNSVKKVIKLDRLIPQTDSIKHILIDFSSPNIAKNMHVGHLRSTIIGDSLCRLFEAEGHTVYRTNHIGDFGLPFGMLIQLLIEKQTQMETITIDDLQEFYSESKKRFDTDPEFKLKSYERLVQLQNGDALVGKYWQYLKDISRKSYNDIYQKLDIQLEEVGESFYQSRLESLVKELNEKHLLVKSDCRQIIQVSGYSSPLTIIKSDGAFTYDSTDLAAIRYRLIELNVDQIIYVVDKGQKEHFDKIFKVAKLMGWIAPHQTVTHVDFGLVLDESGRRIKSRDGRTVKLETLLEESVQKASTCVERIDLAHRDQTIRDLAYGSVKYYDLSVRRTSDYVFTFDKVINLKGNSGPYLMYAYVRINSIINKSELKVEQIMTYTDEFEIKTDYEKDLGVLILQFIDVVIQVKQSLMMHYLAMYMHSLASLFHIFIQHCQCLYFDENGKLIKVDHNRLLLCLLTQRVLKQCFDLMGMKTIQKM